MISVAVYACPGTESHLLPTAHAVFRAASRDVDRYDVRWCTTHPGTLPTADGLDITVQHGLEALDTADVVVIPTWNLSIDPPQAFLDALRAAHSRGATIVGLCLGAVAVAASGLLDGRPMATHWAFAADVATRWRVNVDPSPLWIDHGDVITSAGATAGYDCCLHLVRRHYGAAVAATAASRLVLPPHRDGNQAQHARPLTAAPTAPHDISRAMAYALERLGAALTLDEWAAAVNMSRRTFTRRFRAESGLSPAAWLLNQRLDSARVALEQSDATLEDIAHRHGFADSSSLRSHFRARFNVTPSAYRRTHQA